MGKKRIETDSVAKTKKPYSQGVVVTSGTLVFTSGVISRDRDGQVVGKGDIREQTRQCLRNITGIIEGGGGSLNDLVKMTVFITDLADYDGMNEIRREMLDGIDFASSTVKVALNDPDALIEIEAVASVDG
jgi:2-iminobutanoate/2-iminopropanoate deaminase